MVHCISYWSMKDGLSGTHPIGAALAEGRAAGFGGLELCIAPRGVLTPGTPRGQCQAIRRQIDESGLTVETVASGMSWGVSPTHPRKQVRERAVALHERALERAAWLGCRALLFVPGAVAVPWDPSYPAVPYGQAVKWARQAVGRLARTAEKVKVDLCVENVWNGLFYSPLEFRDFLDSIGSERVKAYFDVGNVLGYHQHPQHWIEILGRRIGRVHIKDFKRSVGNLSGFCDLGEGDVPWPAVAAALGKIGYRSTVVAEMMPWRPDLLTKTARSMRSLLPSA